MGRKREENTPETGHFSKHAALVNSRARAKSITIGKKNSKFNQVLAFLIPCTYTNPAL